MSNPQNTGKELREEFEKINKDVDTDFKHDFKRRLSFDKLDQMIDGCFEGKCPEITDECHYLLVDISLEGYIQERAYYYSIDKIWANDEERYNKSKDRINKVLKCDKQCGIDKGVIDLGFNDLKQNQDSAKRRKAFWSYLSRKNQDKHADYLESSGLVDKFSDAFNQPEFINSIRQEQWPKQAHLINGFELFSLCLLRDRNK